MPLQKAAAILGVSVFASAAEVRTAFREKARKMHPDSVPPDHPDKQREILRRTELIKQVNEAKEAFEKHFERGAPPTEVESESESMDNLRGPARQRVKPVVARPYRPGEIDWAARVPRWSETLNAAVIGIRADGQVDLLVNNTYITTLSSILGVVEHLKWIIIHQVGATPTAWERYFVYLALESSGEITTVGLRTLWERVMYQEGARPHAPDLTSTKRMKPDDFE